MSKNRRQKFQLLKQLLDDVDSDEALEIVKNRTSGKKPKKKPCEDGPTLVTTYPVDFANNCAECKVKKLHLKSSFSLFVVPEETELVTESDEDSFYPPKKHRIKHAKKTVEDEDNVTSVDRKARRSERRKKRVRDHEKLSENSSENEDESSERLFRRHKKDKQTLFKVKSSEHRDIDSRSRSHEIDSESHKSDSRSSVREKEKDSEKVSKCSSDENRPSRSRARKKNLNSKHSHRQKLIAESESGSSEREDEDNKNDNRNGKESDWKEVNKKWKKDANLGRTENRVTYEDEDREERKNRIRGEGREKSDESEGNERDKSTEKDQRDDSIERSESRERNESSEGNKSKKRSERRERRKSNETYESRERSHSKESNEIRHPSENSSRTVSKDRERSKMTKENEGKERGGHRGENEGAEKREESVSRDRSENRERSKSMDRDLSDSYSSDEGRRSPTKGVRRVRDRGDSTSSSSSYSSDEETKSSTRGRNKVRGNYKSCSGSSADDSDDEGSVISSKKENMNKSTKKIREETVSLSPTRRKVKDKKNKREETQGKISDKGKNSNFDLSKSTKSESRKKDFRSDHQLKESNEPAIQAWLERKNLQLKEMRKQKRLEKREKRTFRRKENEVKVERQSQSETKVREWIKKKQREARMRMKMMKMKIFPGEEGEPKDFSTLGKQEGETTVKPPPHYRVVKSLKQVDSSSSNDATQKMFKRPNQRVFEEGVYIGNKANVLDNRNGGVTRGKNIADGEASAVKSDKDTNDYISHGRANSAPPPKTHFRSNVLVRPKTGKNRTVKISEQEKTVDEVQEELKAMRTMTYDEWLKKKQDENREKQKIKKTAEVDEHLESIVTKLGRRRVENILNAKKKLDTGLVTCGREKVRSKSAEQRKAERSPVPRRYKWAFAKTPRPEPQGSDTPDHYPKEGSEKKNEKQHIFMEPIKNPFVVEEISPLPQSVYDVRSIANSFENRDTRLDSKNEKLSRPQTAAPERSTNLETSSRFPSASKRPTSARPKSVPPNVLRSDVEKPILDKNANSDAKTITSGRVYGKVTLEDLIPQELKAKFDNITNEVTDALEELQNTEKSTVRENYFDFGSEVDPETMKPAKFEKPQ